VTSLVKPELKIALVQLSSVHSTEVNWNKLMGLLKNLQGPVDAIFLPEVFLSIGAGAELRPVPISLTHDYFQQLALLAKSLGVYLFCGSVAYTTADKQSNRSLVFNPQGELVDYYDKIHLFKFQHFQENLFYVAGETPKIVPCFDWNVGLTICYDLRFPELFRFYARQGVDIIAVPSAFTAVTGKAHWHTLLKARAIENQCYIIASAQVGEHYPSVHTYGHSLVVSPWGEVMEDMGGESEGVALVTLSKDKITQVRSQMDTRTRHYFK
jgi:predicted amidohydrolase